MKKLDKATEKELYELANLGRQAGLDLATKWLMARLLEVEQAGKRRQRMRTVRLRNSAGRDMGAFKVPAELLANAEEIDD